ncbi:MAG: family 43 glycosylhydrolase [Bacteroidota bacterium]
MRYLILIFTGSLMIILIACGTNTGSNQVMLIETQTSVDTLTYEDVLLLKQIARLRIETSHAGQTVIEGITLEVQVKTVGMITELLNRAEQKILGELPPGRFPWSWSGFTAPDEMADMAGGFLESLVSGKDPFAGKFAEPGGNVVDHAIIKVDGQWHLFYIRGVAATNWPDFPEANFGHAVTGDLLNWEIHEPFLQTDKSEFDSYQVWAPHVIEHNDMYWMFYTGVNDSVSQAICLATSDDLHHWERYEKNPVLNSLPWGFWDETHWSDCRDPMVLKEGDTFYCYYTATRTVPETGGHESCMGMASSKDLIHWNDEGFQRLEHSLTTPPESPFVIKMNGIFYLFYTNYKQGIVYVKGSDPLHWQEDPDDPQTILQGVSATEIFRENGKWYITMISHMDNALRFMEIKELIWHEDGSVSAENCAYSPKVN